MFESGDLLSVLETANDVCGAEVNLQFLQPDTIGGNRKEAGDSRGTGIFEPGVPKEKRLQLSQGLSKLGDVVVQLEDPLALVVFVVAVDLYTEIDQVPETPSQGDTEEYYPQSLQPGPGRILLLSAESLLPSGGGAPPE